MSDEAFDIARQLRNVEITTIFDVGANVGRTVARFRADHPGADVWAFEPVQASFAALTAATDDPRVHCWPIGLSSRAGRGLVRLDEASVNNALVIGEAPADVAVEEVTLETGDRFCAEHGIERIDYLKVDTEGHDLEVLRGFHEMLGTARIAIVNVEVAMNADNHKHVPLARVMGYLEPIGYRLFRVYNQTPQSRTEPQMRRADVTFISPRVIAGALPSALPPRPAAADPPALYAPVVPSLDELAIKHGTDKGTKSFRGLSPKGYTRVYERYLAPLRDQPVRLLEIGVQKGASMRMWEEFFPNAEITGIDIKPECAQYASERVTIRIGDQTDREFLRSVADEMGRIDVIVDDGGHQMGQHRVSLEELWPRVRPGGLYFVEDLHTAYREDYGGGMEAQASTIELFKRLIDDVNGHPREDSPIRDLAEIHFSRSLAVLLHA